MCLVFVFKFNIFISRLLSGDLVIAFNPKFNRMAKMAFGLWMRVISLMIMMLILLTIMEVTMNILLDELPRLELYLVLITQLCFIALRICIFFCIFYLIFVDNII